MANPYQGTESEGAWAMGFAWGFVGPAFSQEPPLVVESLEVFNEGVLAGQEAAINGLPIEPACVSLRQDSEGPPGAEALMIAAHGIEAIPLTKAIGKALKFGKLAGAFAEGFVFAFLAMIPGPPLLSASESFNTVASSLRDQLASLGLASGSLYLGAGIDEDVTDCELRLTPVFRDLEAARGAVTALERLRWVIAEWDTDLPESGGGFRVLEAGGE